jgi:uncharacterized protein (DUF2147 family)
MPTRSHANMMSIMRLEHRSSGIGSRKESRAARAPISMRDGAVADPRDIAFSHSGHSAPDSMKPNSFTTLHPGSRGLPLLPALAFKAFTAAVALTMPPVWADEASPIGLWNNVDDVSGKPRAPVRITEPNGALLGKIEKVFPAPKEDPNQRCDKCDGRNKNAPVIGLVILSGPTKEGEEYVGGQILDPDSGGVYRGNVRLTDNGKQLSVRGYIGVPMLGRSQTWVRQE